MDNQGFSKNYQYFNVNQITAKTNYIIAVTIIFGFNYTDYG